MIKTPITITDDNVSLLVTRFFAIAFDLSYTRHEIYCHIKPNILSRYKVYDLDDMTAEQLKEAIGLLSKAKDNKLLVEPEDHA